MTAFTHAGHYGPEAVIDATGRAQKNVSLSVRTLLGAAATLYADADRSTQITNPVHTDAFTGNLSFYAEPGDYLLVATGGTVQVTVPADPRDLQGEADARVAGDAAATAAAAALVDDLSGVTNPSAARTALGLGSAATHPATDFDTAGAAAAVAAASVPLTQKGAANGVPTLDASSLIPDTQIPPGIARDAEVTAAVSAATNALLNGAGPAYDTLKELQDLLTSDEATASALATTVAGKAQRLTRTTVKTANYTAAAGDLIPVDTATPNADITVTLPTAPVAGSRVVVKHILLGAGRVVTVACGGSDVFNRAGGLTTATLPLANQAINLQYDAGIWTVVSDDLAKGSLDALYQTYVVHGSTAGTARPTGAGLVHWIGSVAPTNAATNDEWTDTANKLLKRWNGTSFDALGSPASSVASLGNSGTTFTMQSAATAGMQTVTLTGNATGTLPTPAAGQQFVLRATQDATGGRTLAFTGATVSYPAGSLQLLTAAGTVNEILFTSWDGTTWEGVPVTDGTITSKGDLIVGSGSGAVARQAPGADGQSVVYDSTQPNGVKADWRVPAQENVNTVGTSGAAQTIPDPVTAQSISRITMTANCTFTFPTAGAGKSFTLLLVQDATGSRTASWPGTVKWSGGTAPILTTTSAKVDVLSFLCADGTNWLGFAAGLNF